MQINRLGNGPHSIRGCAGVSGYHFTLLPPSMHTILYQYYTNFYYYYYYDYDYDYDYYTE
jgi:hypothetical protein